MKISTLTFTVASLISASALATANPQPAAGHGIEFLPQHRKAPVVSTETDASLKARRASGKFGGFAPDGAAPKGWDLMENSQFIAFEGVSTLLPKGSILHTPLRFQQHIVAQVSGTLMVWSEFAARYRGLVTPFPVTLEQASGQTPIDLRTFEAAKNSGFIVVAMMDGNPVSVSPKALETPAAVR